MHTGQKGKKYVFFFRIDILIKKIKLMHRERKGKNMFF